MSVKVSIIVPVYNVENYIENMLKSVAGQTFTDFEVIMINDGSTDGSQQIMDKFCASDDRFISYTQENAGVSAARNKGLEIAQGEYVVFYDPDDHIPENALTDMYHKAREEMADMVIGMMELFDIAESRIASPTGKLARRKRINKFEKDLNWSFSVCNKMFRRSIIEDIGLRFEGLKHGEDGVFTFSYIHACDRIAGCNRIVYHYRKRIPWKSSSATQMVSKNHLDDLHLVFQRLLSIVEDSYARSMDALKGKSDIEVEELECTYKDYRSDLYARFVDTSLLGEYYRYIWRIDDEMYDFISERIREYRNHMFSKDWKKKVLDRNKDLMLNKRIMITREELAESPIMSFVISSGISPDAADKVLSCIYNQSFPSFEVLIDECHKGHMDEAWLEKMNFHVLKHDANTSNFKKKALKSLKGQYACFIDEDIFFPGNFLEKIYEEFLDNIGKNVVFITVPMKKKVAESYEYIEAHRPVFVNELVKQKIRSSYNQLDYVWGNKFFAVSALKAKKILFTGDPWRDIHRLYNNSTYIKDVEMSVYADLEDKDILSRVKSPKVRLLYGRKLKQEERRLRKIESYDEQIITFGQHLKQWRLRQMRSGFRFLTRKIMFPLQYKRYRGRPVDPHKVVFVEPRFEKLPSSMALIRERFANMVGFTVHEHYLKLNASRYRHQFKICMDFIRDIADAKFIVLADANEVFSCVKLRKETVALQTWHGCGAFKKFGNSTVELMFGDNKKLKRRYPQYKNLDLVTVSSPEVVWAYKEAMVIDTEDIVKAVGISRTDVFFDESYIADAHARIEQIVPMAKNKKIIVYAPTFRGRIAKAKGPDRLDIEKLAKALSEEYILLIKHHPFVKRLPDIPAEYRDSFAFDVTHTASIEDLICVGDICISDYSSLIFEYSLFEKPMVFFAYDLEEYFDWRGFYYDYYELAPGPILSSTEEILHYIRNIDELFDKQSVIDFRKKFMSACDGHATDRIMEAIMNMK